MPYNYLCKYPEIKTFFEANMCPTEDYHVNDRYDAKFMVRPKLIKIDYKSHKKGLLVDNMKLRHPMRYLFLCFNGKLPDNHEYTLKINGMSTKFMVLPTSNCVLYADLGPLNHDFFTVLSTGYTVCS